MNANQTDLLLKLIELSKVDESLARIKAERKKIEDELADKLLKIQESEKTLQLKSSEVKAEQYVRHTEEKRLKEENEKLVERRKALSSFSDYKVQQSAQKEIEQASKQLAAQEEKLIAGFDHLEAAETEVKELEEDLTKQKEEVQKLESESKEALSNLEERFQDKTKAREALVQGIDKKELVLYERIKNKHIDPVVRIDAGVCSGCYIQVGAQMMVQVSRGNSLVKCRGCGRILYLADQTGDEASAESA